MTHESYMRRALQIARCGFPDAFPNPMVGAVIVDAHGSIIGEGYHRRCGSAHAEVNALAAVADKTKLSKATMYVTLEPCAHYGRTPPCAKTIIEHGIPHVVVGCRDPFPSVDGKGIEMMRAAGIDVEVGVCRNECQRLNAVFFTAHTLKRAFVMLKWAASADGYIDIHRAPGTPAARISTPATMAMMHRCRAFVDAIAVGSNTVLADNPSLTTRLWPGKSPRPVVFDARGRLNRLDSLNIKNPLIISDNSPLDITLGKLYETGITSLMVEGGAYTLQRFIDSGLWDIARVETAPVVFGEKGSVRQPCIGNRAPAARTRVEGNSIVYYTNNNLVSI